MVGNSVFFSKKSKQFSKLFRFLKILSARSKIFSKIFCQNHKKIEGIFNKREKKLQNFRAGGGLTSEKLDFIVKINLKTVYFDQKRRPKGGENFWGENCFDFPKSKKKTLLVW